MTRPQTMTPPIHSLTILTPLPAERPPIRAVVFDFDGTISTLRQGWERSWLR